VQDLAKADLESRNRTMRRSNMYNSPFSDTCLELKRLMGCIEYKPLVGLAEKEHKGKAYEDNDREGSNNQTTCKPRPRHQKRHWKQSDLIGYYQFSTVY